MRLTTSMTMVVKMSERDSQDHFAVINRIETEVDMRNREALSVYRPMHSGQQRIHESTATELLVRGGKRSGKTLGVICEFGSRLLGRQLFDMSGNLMPIHWDSPTPTSPRLYWIIGWAVNHLGQSMYPYLFMPGMGTIGLRVIRDLETGEWRCWNEKNTSDESRYLESELCGPIIPDYMVKSKDWESKSAGYFREIALHNGAILRAYPSSSKNPKMGDKVSGIWIDEDIQVASHLDEWQDRLTDAHGGGGWFMWSVWPKVNNYALVQLLERAEEQEGEENPDIEAVQLVMTENAYITDEAKEKSLGRMGSEEARARRNRGELLLDHLSMYDYAAPIHGITKFNEHDLQNVTINRHSILRSIYTLNNGSWPADWTRYISVDPSHTRTAVLFGAVPPREVMVGNQRHVVGNCMVVENELVIEKCSAPKLAQEVKRMSPGKFFNAFIMDRRMGQQTTVGADINVFQRYAEAFASVQLESQMTKSGFIPGCDKPRRRYEDVRNLLSGDGWPYLFFDVEKCPNTIREFNTYRKKQANIAGLETVMEEPANPRKHDCMAALEYLCSHITDAFRSNTAFAIPVKSPHQSGQVYQFAQSILAQQGLTKKPDDSYVHLGPGSSSTLGGGPAA